MRRVIDPSSEQWPDRLNELGAGMPKQLHIEGDDLPPSDQCIAIVGTRMASIAGLSTARAFAQRFAEAGYVVVSGMARGIDTAAHRGALEGGGRTIAVMGCGLNLTYPPRNQRLKEQIANQGTIVSEYEDDVPSAPYHFPQRNRIVAGLVRGAVVIEGGLKSGALITARAAADLDRQVWAVPGAVNDPRSEGANHLIRTEQAALVTLADHVFEAIAPEIAWTTDFNRFPGKPSPLEDEEREVLSALSSVPATADDLYRGVALPAGRVALVLSKLEIRGLTVSSRGGTYVLSESGARALGVPTPG
jgi:DNA processing protein